jgi:hypothetical protein
MRKWNNSKSRLGALVLSVVLLSACNDTLLTSFKIGIAASRPFVSSLISSGVIGQSQADSIFADLDSGVSALDRGDTCIKAIPKDTAKGPKRIAKGKCYFQAAQDLRVILEHHNIGGNPTLDKIATIVSGAIEAFEAYFNSVSSSVSVTSRAGVIQRSAAEGPNGEAADKKIEQTMKDLKKQMDDVNKEMKEAAKTKQ